LKLERVVEDPILLASLKAPIFPSQSQKVRKQCKGAPVVGLIKIYMPMHQKLTQ